jgi:SSS family solute:Na+ symporter
VVVAFVFLPKLLRCGIYTIPEFLEYRYGVVSRTVMAISTLVILVGVPTASVIYSGAKVVSVFFAGQQVLGLDLGSITVGCWIIGLSAAAYVFVGGLKACAWTDLIWGAALIVGGAVVMWLALSAMKNADPQELMATKVANSSATLEDIEKASGWERFILLNDGKDGEAVAVEGENMSGGKLHMIRPKSDPAIPWTALVLGLWIPNFFYWGLNQYIVQRTLGSKSLAEGQKGIVFAAALKLIIPFVVVIPGILCFNLYSKDLRAEAMKKNNVILAAIGTADETGKLKVHPVTGNFAKVDPENTIKVIEHNARVLGEKVDITGATPEKLSQVNTDLLAIASTKKVPVGTKLIGYDYDAAFPMLLRKLLQPGITWFVLAAIFGAVVSSLASMLNSASTIATIDIFQKLKPDSTQDQLVGMGKFFTVLFVLISCLIAPNLGNPAFGGIFTFIQEFQGFISPGVLMVFLFGFLVPRAPRFLGWLGILVNVVLYAYLYLFQSGIPFLNRMAICFGVVFAVMSIITLVKPMEKPVVMPTTDLIALESSKVAKIWAVGVVIATIALYIYFW